jgi:sialidase-1
MKHLIILLHLVAAAIVLTAQTNSTPVFTAGTEGHKSYRIPAIIKSGKTLLAFAEGRVNNSGDFGNVNIVLKRSKDNGKTWGALQTIVDYDTLQAGNPAPVVDLTDPAYPKGRIFLFYNTGNNSEGEVRKGNGLRQVWYKTSSDDGITWSQPVNITVQVHRPKQPAANAAYNFAEDWRSYANTPGHAIQLRGERFKGRIFVAANHTAGPPQKKFEDYRAFGYYTDDHGKTFHLGADIAIAGGNESMATELPGGTVMMNLRNQQGDTRTRIVALSRTGGASWDTAYYDHQLPDPVCQGSILTIGYVKGHSILAFCNDAATRHRDSLTLRISYDEGASWQKSFPIATGPRGYKGDFSAYSDLVNISKNKIGILYEKENYSVIVYTEISW